MDSSTATPSGKGGWNRDRAGTGGSTGSGRSGPSPRRKSGTPSTIYENSHSGRTSSNDDDDDVADQHVSYSYEDESIGGDYDDEDIPLFPSIVPLSSGLRERSYTGGSLRSVGSLESAELLTAVSLGGPAFSSSSPATAKATVAIASSGSSHVSVPSLGANNRLSKPYRSKRTRPSAANTSGKDSSLTCRAVDWIQRQRVSTRWFEYVGISTSSSAAGNNSGNQVKTVPLVSGLDRVLFGPYSCADAVTFGGGALRPPRYLWYMISGFGCDLIQVCIDVLLHFGFGITDAPTCWTVSFSLSIVFRHTAHRYLVFGMYVGGYYRSLLRMYTGYSVSIILSSLFNRLLAEWHVPHYGAYIFTLLWTGVVNYFILKRMWSFGGSTTSANA
jgi:hypothetical protein